MAEGKTSLTPVRKKFFSSTDSKKIRYEDSSGNDKRGSERIYGTATYVGV